jgi:Putative mono-oxygenase ydhR
VSSVSTAALIVPGMYLRIVTFRLDGPSHDAYVAQANAIADAFAAWPGLCSKVWLADEESGRYGGVYVFASKADADASRQTPEFLSLVSLPTFRDVTIEEFDILDEPTAVTGGPLAA